MRVGKEDFVIKIIKNREKSECWKELTKDFEKKLESEGFELRIRA